VPLLRYIISLTLASLLALPVAAEVPSVKTDIQPVGSLVAQVIREFWTPSVLLDTGADPQSLQMHP